VSLNTVARYRQELGLKAVLAVKQVNTTIPIKENKKYSYSVQCPFEGCKLRGLKNLGITISMDGKGRATDNIYIERFYPSRGYRTEWRSAKCERIYLNEY